MHDNQDERDSADVGRLATEIVDALDFAMPQWVGERCESGDDLSLVMAAEVRGLARSVARAFQRQACTLACTPERCRCRLIGYLATDVERDVFDLFVDRMSMVIGDKPDESEEDGDGDGCGSDVDD